MPPGEVIIVSNSMLSSSEELPGSGMTARSHIANVIPGVLVSLGTSDPLFGRVTLESEVSMLPSSIAKRPCAFGSFLDRFLFLKTRGSGTSATLSVGSLRSGFF